uniref:Crossover junction endonuclease MUS81 n=1 Tax=Syphacia muris TaxID=451379 RepID=A0A0N5ASK4_9BILA
MEFDDYDEAMDKASITVVRRVKVRETFLRKTFFERVLASWKESVTDRNFRHTLTKALVNLKNFPLEVDTSTELRNVKGHGIGDYIAQKLESSWNNFCAGFNPVPRVTDVKCLKHDQLLSFLQLDSSSSNISTKNQCIPSKAVSCDRKRSQAMVLEAPLSENQKQKAVGGLSGCDNVNVYRSNDFFPHSRLYCETLTLPSNSNDFAATNLLVKEGSTICDRQLYSNFSEENSEVVMIVDNREKHFDRDVRSVYNYLEAEMDSKFELRNLSVGDYTWVLRSPEKVEVMLDYIVERKTFNDLSQSIRQGRYEEQKIRLLSIGIRNVVYVVEGTGEPDAMIEQALVTTQVVNGFLLHKTSNAKETAKFLNIITKRLKERTKITNELQMTFETFQKNAKKTQRRCVKDIFMRQLTVCPQMSAIKAALITSRFPSLLALTKHFKSLTEQEKEMFISNSVPGIPTSLSRQLSKFFLKV